MGDFNYKDIRWENYSTQRKKMKKKKKKENENFLKQLRVIIYIRSVSRLQDVENDNNHA